METVQEREAVVRWLASRDSYSPSVDHVDHLETHISHVFLAGPRVYKLKKPVKYDFLDFSTIANRELACHEEVRLNRRLAPEAYLGVVPVTLSAENAYQFGGNGAIVDWLVEMRRLPTELTLDALHARNQLRREHIERLTAALIPFYQSLLPLPLTPEGYRRRFLGHVCDNLRVLRERGQGLSREVVERVHGFQLQLLLLRPVVFEERVRTGHIVDGHGDLRPEHVCLSDPVTVFDCIEFSAEFRTIDVVDELAFLAAECDFLGADWVGPQVLDTYQQKTGDQPPAVLWAFYKAYRACVRAKVAALRAEQISGESQAAAIAEAQRHLALADQFAGPWIRPVVLVVGGAAGSGKSTLATALADALCAALLRTDLVRQELFRPSFQTSAVDAGIYGRAEREQVYDELFHRAKRLHADARSVVLDGTFSTTNLVREAEGVASTPGSIVLAIECICRPEIARARILQRLAAGSDASEARPELHDIQRKRWEAWSDSVAQVRIDTEQPLEKQVDQVLASLAALVLSSGA